METDKHYAICNGLHIYNIYIKYVLYIYIYITTKVTRRIFWDSPKVTIMERWLYY